MKRLKLEKALRDLGWKFLRRGGNHDVWTDGERQEAIPRHREINEKLAQFSGELQGIGGTIDDALLWESIQGQELLAGRGADL